MGGLKGSIDWLSDQSLAKDDSGANGWIYMVDADAAPSGSDRLGGT